MTTLTFNTNDPSLLSSVLKVQSPLPTDLAVRCELWSWANDYRMANPTATVDDLVSAFVTHKNDIAREMSGHQEFPYDIPDDLNQIFKFAGDAVKLIPYEHAEGTAEGVIGLLKDVMEFTPVEEWIKDYRGENIAEASADITARIYPICDSIVANVAPILRVDPVFNQALAKVDPNAAAGGATIPTAPGDVLQAHEDVFNQTIIKQYFTVQVDSGLSAQIDNVQQTINDELNGISTQMQQQYTSLHSDIAQLQAGQKALLAYVSDQQARQTQAAQAAAQKAQYEAVFAAAQTAVNVLASVVNLVDPKLGRQIAQVGTASVQVGRAAFDMVNAITNCMSATLTTASALGAAVATGNFIGAALNLVNIFTGLGAESPEQMILEQIGQIRQQIDAFHQDMTARFDQVDRELNTIYSNVMTALNKIDIQLGHIQDTVDRVLSDVVAEQIKLDRIIRSLGAYFTNQYRLPLQTAINTDLGWPSGQPMSIGEFLGARGVFYTFACQGAYADPQESPVDNRPTDNASLAQELSGPVDQNIAFANHVLAARGWPTFASDTPGGRLPNPLTWSVAAAAYAQLEAEQSALAAAAIAGETHSKRDDVRAGGLELAQASAALRTLLLPSGAGTPLLDTLLNNYASAVHDWDAAVPASYARWQEYLRTQMGQQTDLHLWDGPDQDFGYTPSGLSTQPAANLPPPANLRGSIPTTFFVADWLGLGKVSVTYVTDWTITTRKIGSEIFDFYTLWVDVTVTYTNVPLWRRRVTGPTYNENVVPSIDAALSANWTSGSNMKALFEAGAGSTQTGMTPAEQTAADALTATTHSTVVTRINGVRTEYFAWIATQSSAPNASTPAPLFYTQASAIDGARALLDLLITLAFEQPRYGDDLLRALFDGLPQPNGLRLPDANDLLAAVVGMDPSSILNTGPAFTPWSDALTVIPQQLIRARLQQWQAAAAQNLWKPTLLAAERNLLRLGVSEAIITAEGLAKSIPMFSAKEDWTHGVYYGTRGTFFADVTGDGKADAIIVSDTTVTVRRSNGSAFGAKEDWTHGAYYGSRGTFFADVTGDGKADAIAVTDSTVLVRRSTGSAFGPKEDWTHGAYHGTRGTFFADVTGDGKADAIIVNDDKITVRRSTGSTFGAYESWTTDPFFGSRGTFFADVDGDGKADAIAVTDSTVLVRRSTGRGFGPVEDWTHGVYYGSRGTFFADVDGDKRADAIAVTDSTVTVRRSSR